MEGLLPAPTECAVPRVGQTDSFSVSAGSAICCSKGLWLQKCLKDLQREAFRNVTCPTVHLQTNAWTHESSGYLAVESWQKCGERHGSVFAFGDRDNPGL